MSNVPNQLMARMQVPQGMVFHSVYVYVCVYVCRGGTVHRCYGSVRTSVRGSRFDTISVQLGKKQQIYYAGFLLIYFEQSSTVVILNIILLYIYNLQYIYTYKE